MIRVKDIKISITSKEHDLKKALAKKLGIFKEDILEVYIYKKSIDARNKNNIIFTYTLNAKVKNEEKFKDLIVINEDTYPKIKIKRTKKVRPIIVGAGPSGLFCGLILAKEGFCPIILEQGKDVDSRKEDIDNFWKSGKLNIKSNVQFGEGGAGTFSDGKLTTLINNSLCNFVLEEFVKAGAPEEILYLSKPHLGTDNLINIVKNIRKEIIKLGGEIRFNKKVTDIKFENDKIKEVLTEDGETISTDTLVLAIGHSSRDTFELLKEKNVSMIPKPFSVGVRVEHLQEDINKAQYGKFFDNEMLDAAEYKMAYHDKDGRGTYTFCMCPGGQVVASSSEEGRLVTNGMSYYKRDGVNANSAVLVSVSPEDFDGDDVLRGMYYQRKLEEKAFLLGGSNYSAPVQKVEDYIKNVTTKELGKVKPTYLPGYKLSNLNELFDEKINNGLKNGLKYMGKRLNGFDSNDAILTGVETRSSSPVRILRDEMMQSNIKGVYPCGEGAGYAGGIMSAAVDGIKVAIALLENE